MYVGKDVFLAPLFSRVSGDILSIVDIIQMVGTPSVYDGYTPWFFNIPDYSYIVGRMHSDLDGHQTVCSPFMFASGISHPNLGMFCKCI